MTVIDIGNSGVLETKQLVCRRVMRSGVVVASLHPVLGPIYWDYTDESDCNAPDSFGVTDNLHSATIFKSMFYLGHSFESFRCGVISSLIDEDDWCIPDDDDEIFDTPYCWTLKDLAHKAYCTPSDLASWMRSAIWVEYPAPLTINYLKDFNGFLGYRAEWTKELSEASRWDSSSLDSDDLDDELARSFGELVPIAVADQVSKTSHRCSKINHALEADFSYTLHRLRLREPGVAPWAPTYEEKAWAHAARAGWEHVVQGDSSFVSDHITAFPELLRRFEMAAALARYDLRKKLDPSMCGENDCRSNQIGKAHAVQKSIRKTDGY